MVFWFKLVFLGEYKRILRMQKLHFFHWKYIPVLFLMVLFQNCSSPRDSRSEIIGEESDFYTEDDFAEVKKHDVHVHLRKDFDTLFLEQAKEDNFGLLNVSVFTFSGTPPRQQEDFSVRLLQNYPGRIAFATAFSLDNFNENEWEQKTLSYLDSSFSKGAIAVKVWKNIGMELKDNEGNLVMIDDARFDPVFEFMEDQNITLIGHLGEPKNTWLPLEEMTVQGDRDYFGENPQYHMYNLPELPTYEDQIAARDRMLEKHPDLKFVGAHLGSLEWNVDELAKRLDQFPHMAVDMAERISHLQHQAVTDWQKVHDFLIKYQDRLLYGTDLRTGASDIQAKGLTESEDIKAHAHEVWLRHWNFFTSDDRMEVPKVKGEFQGMKLPKEVVDKIYRTNAEKWFPALTDYIKH
jgi:predicted TIM-barrel fold metal-dependent hydrolase